MNHLFKPQEILVVNSDLKQFTFSSVKHFQQVYVNCYKDSYDFEGNHISGMENKNSVQYVLANLHFAKNGLPLKLVDGDKTDYSKVKLLVIDAVSKIQDMMFDYADTFLNLPNSKGNKDKRNTYTEYWDELKNFLRFVNMIKIPLVGITHDMEYSKDNGPITTKPYYIGAKSVEIIPRDFSIIVFTDIDKTKLLSSQKDMYRFAIQTDGDIAPKGLYGFYPEEIKFIPNDLLEMLKVIYNFYGLKTKEEIDNFLIPNILIVGPSGSGKTFSLRNLIGEE